MARKSKKNDDFGFLVIVIVLFVIYLLSKVPKEIWVLIIVIGAVYLLYKLFSSGTQDSGISTGLNNDHNDRSDRDQQRLIISTSYGSAQNYTIPKPKKIKSDAKWIPKNEVVEIQGVTINGGFIYLGSNLPGQYDENDPSLINPNLKIAAAGDFSQGDLGYWPKYENLSPFQKRSYLEWLSQGRNAPSADIGYVFIYFYGLERRVLIDASKDPSISDNEYPLIVEEIKRLIDIYAEDSYSFKSYAGSLLDFIYSSKIEDKLYLKDFSYTEFPRSYELPIVIKASLGQAAIDNYPIPSKLALTWVRLWPIISLRTPAHRCQNEFDKLFIIKYESEFKEGLTLKSNKTKLKLSYRPASAGIPYIDRRSLSHLPDVSVLTGPQNKLQKIVDDVTKELDSYSRYIGRNPDRESQFESALLLPLDIWPTIVINRIHDIKKEVNQKNHLLLSFSDFLKKIGVKSELTRDQVFNVAKVLKQFQIGIEPNFLDGVKVPKLDQQIAIFEIADIAETHEAVTSAYLSALLTTQLAVAVAHADGTFSRDEKDFILRQISSWNHLSKNHIDRLKANLDLLEANPLPLSALKKKFEIITSESKNAIASFMATVAQSDGVVTPDEVRLLEKIYQALGIDPKNVFSDVHAIETGNLPGEQKHLKQSFKLDKEKIQLLQKDTADVSKILADIFQEDHVEGAIKESIEEAITEEEHAVAENTVLGLSGSLANFARVIITRPSWSRDELSDLADDQDLMLDGALEEINEASFELYDMPLFDGDDPIDINAEILERL